VARADDPAGHGQENVRRCARSRHCSRSLPTVGFGPRHPQPLHVWRHGEARQPVSNIVAKRDHMESRRSVYNGRTWAGSKISRGRRAGIVWRVSIMQVWVTPEREHLNRLAGSREPGRRVAPRGASPVLPAGYLRRTGSGSNQNAMVEAVSKLHDGVRRSMSRRVHGDLPSSGHSWRFAPMFRRRNNLFLTISCRDFGVL